MISTHDFILFANNYIRQLDFSNNLNNQIKCIYIYILHTRIENLEHWFLISGVIPQFIALFVILKNQRHYYICFQSVLYSSKEYMYILEEKKN